MTSPQVLTVSLCGHMFEGPQSTVKPPDWGIQDLFLPVLGPPRGPWEGHFCPILPGNLLKTNKNPYLPLFYAEIPHFTLEIPINTLVPCRIRVIIGNPSENPQKPQIWARGPK